MVVYFNQKVEIMKKPKKNFYKKLFLLLTIQTDGQSKKLFFNKWPWFLEGTRLSVKNTTQNLQYFIPIRHARYQRVYQLLNLKPKSISSYTPFLFLSFCIFFLFFPRLRTSCFYRFGPKASNSCTLFLVRTCLKLPSPGHAKHCRRHHFWTGLARLFRTIKRNIDIFCVFESFGFFSFLNVGE